MAGIKKVVIYTFQFSVVVKGIEKKITELGFQVNTLKDDINKIFEYMEFSELLVIYLPNDFSTGGGIMDLTRVVLAMKEQHRKVIMIGDDKIHDEMLRRIPDMASFEWVDRPVDFIKFEELIDRVMNTEVVTDNQKRILIVDDDPSYAKIVREWLKDFYHVDMVTSGSQALSFLLRNQANLILLDYEMPVADGPEVLKMLRSEPRTANIPVIFLTGVGTKESVSRVLQLKPAGYILKSTSKEDLIKTLMGFFAKH